MCSSDLAKWNKALLDNAARPCGALTYAGPEGTLLPGTSRTDYRQLVLGQDVSFAWHHWQFWGEAIATRFDVPRVGDVETLGYFIEAKYKLTPNIFTALRWNQQFFDKVSDGAGGRQPWDYDAWRVDAALGWRLTRHLQTKLQYSFNHQKGPLQQGEQLVAAQATVKF